MQHLSIAVVQCRGRPGKTCHLRWQMMGGCKDREVASHFYTAEQWLNLRNIITIVCSFTPWYEVVIGTLTVLTCHFRECATPPYTHQTFRYEIGWDNSYKAFPHVSTASNTHYGGKTWGHLETFLTPKVSHQGICIPQTGHCSTGLRIRQTKPCDNSIVDTWLPLHDSHIIMPKKWFLHLTFFLQ